MNYSKISGEDRVKLCTLSPETARSFLSIHQLYWGQRPTLGPGSGESTSLQGAGRCRLLSHGQALAAAR